MAAVRRNGSALKYVRDRKMFGRVAQVCGIPVEV
jgi:hypothetical protein